MRERQQLEQSVSAVRKLEGELSDAAGLLEMAEAENDAAMIADAEKAIEELHSHAEKLRLESMLSGEADGNDTYLKIHAGAGGTESQDWAEMLFRMYMRWAERHGYKLQLIEESEGEGAGIKSTTLLVPSAKTSVLPSPSAASAPNSTRPPFCAQRWCQSPDPHTALVRPANTTRLPAPLACQKVRSQDW